MDIIKLLNDRKEFDSFVYTPLKEAIKENLIRSRDVSLDNYIGKELLSIPKCLSIKRVAVLSRSLAVLNYESEKFLDITKDLDGFKPLFWEYYGDRFTPNVNKSKHFMGKLTFNIKDKNRVQKKAIIDFNLYNGKTIDSIKTLWGESLIDFHKSLFLSKHKNLSKDSFFDASAWYKENGKDIKSYYKKKLILFLKNGILFENFILEDPQEGEFILKIFLPAFMEIVKETGKKPLITVLDHRESEGSDYWMYYPQDLLSVVKDKFNLIQ